MTDNRLVAQGVNPATTTYSYDAVSNISGYAFPNGVQSTYSYDSLNRLTQVGSSGTGALSSFAYTLGAAGNRTNVLELNGRNVAYGYDNDYRLTSEAITGDPAGNNGTVSYTSYDGVGNRLQMTSTLNAVPGGSFSYDANDRIAGDTFDNNGNTISSTGISYVYDFENRLLMRGAVTIVYDGDGNRVSETVGGVTTKFLVDTLNPTGLPQVMDETVSGSVTRTYAYGLDRISENQLIGSTWTPSFYGYDGHGNVRFLANSGGAVTDTYTFDAFGNQIASTGTTPNNFLYSGEQFDLSTGLYYLRARYYRDATGRFLTMDPYQGTILNPRTLQKYAYSGNDPVNFVDPTGHDAVEYVALLKKVTAVALITAQVIGYPLALIFECASEEIHTEPHTIGPNPPVHTVGPLLPSPGQVGPFEPSKCFEPPHVENPPAMLPVPGPARPAGEPPSPVEGVPVVEILNPDTLPAFVPLGAGYASQQVEG